MIDKINDALKIASEQNSQSDETYDSDVKSVSNKKLDFDEMSNSNEMSNYNAKSDSDKIIPRARFILSKSKAISIYESLKSLGARVSFSFKTNPEVGKVLEDNTDSELSCHSLDEVERISNKSRVWYLPQGWSKDEIAHCLDIGINKFVIDNINDLNMLDDVMSERIPRQITLLLRMKMKENTIHTGKYFVYGMDSKIVNEKLKEFRKKSYIDKLGVHFHRKTQNVSEWNIVDELNDSVDDFDLIDIVNIGGGLPVKYKNTSDFSIDAIFDKINNLNTFLKSKNIQLMIEPGRFISGPSVILETSVINVFDKNIILNASVYNSSPDIIVYSIKLLVDKENDSDESGTEYLLKGNTACSMDIFRYKVKFSTSPKVGDKIIFLNAGAYNYCTDFMSLKRLDTVIID